MQLKKVTQKNSDGSSISYEFSVPPKQEIPHPGNPKGTDTVPAWLTPGEFVMNAEATRMYKPQIEAMNEQGKAVQRQQGGSIPSYHAKGGEAGPCWDGYEMVGMKEKGGKKVPNCVPQYKEEGGIIDWLSSLFGGDVPRQEAVQAASEIPPEIIPSDYNVRPLDLPPESSMVQPQAAVPTPAVPNDYLSNMTQAESSGRADAKNPNSSATGLHQFTAPTWLAVAKKYEPELANSMSEEELLALRTDPATSTRMANHLTNENKRILERKDIATTNDNLYLLHFGGPSSGVKAITAADDTKAEDIFTPGQLKANPFLKGMTAKEIRAWSKGKVGGEDQAATTDVPQIFSNAVASGDTPTGGYFPSDVSDERIASLEVPTMGVKEVPGSIEKPAGGDTFRASPETLETIGNAEAAIEGAISKAGEVPEVDSIVATGVIAKENEALENEIKGLESQLLNQKLADPNSSMVRSLEEQIASKKARITANNNSIMQSDKAEAEIVRQEAAQDAEELSTAIDEMKAAGIDTTEQEAELAKLQEQAKQPEDRPAWDTPEIRQSRTEATKNILAATQEQADAEGLTDEEFTDAIIDDMDNRAREAVTGQPELLDRTMSFFEEYGITDLFDKKEIGKMAMMYIGSRIMGYSHGGSLNFAVKNYATNVQNKQDQHAKNIQSLLKEGKYSKASIAAYEKSKDVDDLVPAGNTYTPTGDMPEFILYKGKKMKVQKVKGSDGGYYYQNGAGEIVPMLSSNVSAYQAWLDPQAKEYKEYRHQSREAARKTFEEQAKLYNTDEDGNYYVSIDPDTASRHFVEWAKSVGLDPQSDEAFAIMGNAYRTAVEEGKAADYDITELEPYLNAQFIREQTGSQELFRTNPDETNKRPTYVNGPDLAKLRSFAEREAMELTDKIGRQVAVKEMYNHAQSAWMGLSDEERKQYNDSALKDQTGFYKFFMDELEKNAFDRKITK